jgi:hypothetical protein
MSQPLPGPYPVYPQYPVATALPRPPVPPTVQRAFYLMLGGAALTLLSLVLSVAEVGTIRRDLTTSRADNPALVNESIDTLVRIAVAVLVIVALLEVGLWVWMAFTNRAGRNWARITSTVFFGVAVVFTLIGLAASAGSAGRPNTTFASSDTAIGKIVGIVNLLVGLLVIIMLWNKQSTAFFKPQLAYGYPQGPTPGYFAPGYPSQAPGYPPAGYPGPGPADQPADPWATPPQQ